MSVVSAQPILKNAILDFILLRFKLLFFHVICSSESSSINPTKAAISLPLA